MKLPHHSLEMEIAPAVVYMEITECLFKDLSVEAISICTSQTGTGYKPSWSYATLISGPVDYIQ